jgi:hypothetical protein
MTVGLKRDGLPIVHTHGIDFARAIIDLRISFDVMAFDGCGHIASPNTWRCVNQMAKVARSGSVLAATILAGRECGETAEALQQNDIDYRMLPPHLGKTSHFRRLLWLEQMLTASWSAELSRLEALWSVAARKRSRYMSSSKQPMLWLAIRIAPRVSRNVSITGYRMERGHHGTTVRIQSLDVAIFRTAQDNPSVPRHRDGPYRGNA